jgi:hypothetical protein
MPLTGEEAAEVAGEYPDDPANQPPGAWNRLATTMHRRGRLVHDPEGRTYWSDHPGSAGDLMPPG